jgi:hypothetical protein
MKKLAKVVALIGLFMLAVWLSEKFLKNFFTQNVIAKLAQKLRWHKATKSNFCYKVFVGFELLVMCFYLPKHSLSKNIIYPSLIPFSHIF